MWNRLLNNSVKSKLEDVESLQELVQSIVPTVVIGQPEPEDDSESPLVQILANALYSNVKLVREAYQDAKNNAYSAEE